MSHEWQPIETAPKDGRAILIYQPDYDVGGGRSHERRTMGRVTQDEIERVPFDDKRYAIGYWRPWGGWGNRNSATVNPSHWMPLPALPEWPALPPEDTA